MIDACNITDIIGIDLFGENALIVPSSYFWQQIISALNSLYALAHCLLHFGLVFESLATTDLNLHNMGNKKNWGTFCHDVKKSGNPE